MRDSTRYLRAAEAIDSGEEDYSCIAIAGTYPLNMFVAWKHLEITLPAQRSYIDMFVDDPTEAGLRGMDKLQELIELSGYGLRELRVLLLCLAAAIAKSEGK